MKDIEPRPEVEWFAKRMERKLRLNDHKQHWSKLHTDYLIERLFQEANELWLALRNGETTEMNMFTKHTGRVDGVFLQRINMGVDVVVVATIDLLTGCRYLSHQRQRSET